MVYWSWLGSRLATVWLKYLGQTLETWKVLGSERADVAFVMTPPPIAIIPVYLYCTLRRIPFVVDAHSGVFLTNRWRFFQGLQFWLCRRAATTIVTNEYLAGLVRSHGGHAVVIPDVPVEFNDTASPPADVDGFTVVFVTSFDRDEPIGSMIEAARRLPDVQFLMTGDPGRAIEPQLLPPNLRLTGFLQTETYGALLRHAGVVVALTTDDFTMQRAAYEGIFQGTPVIVSDTELLRSSFDEGAVHVDNTPDAITKAILRVRGSNVEYRQAALHLRARKRERWLRAKSELLAILDGT